MHKRKLPPLGYQCCDPRGGHEGCCGLFVKVAAPTPAQPCGQCAHLMKTVEELQRQLRLEEDTVNKSVMRYIRQNASLDELKRDNLNLREQLNAVLALVSEAENMHPTDPSQWQLLQEICRVVREANNIGNDAQTSSALTRNSESGQKGVTAGETASQDLNTHLHDAAGLRPVAEKPDGAYYCSTPCVCGANCGLPVGETPALLDALKGLLALSKRELADQQDCDAIRVAEDAIDHAEGRWTPEIPALENAMEDCRVCSRPFGDTACDHRLKR